jgi:hypothetical protein
VHRETADAFVPRGHPIAAALVQADRHVIAVAENLPDQSGERGPGTHLDERPHACGVHRLDLVTEPDRRGGVLGQRMADRAGFTAVDRRVGVAVDIDTRRGQLECVQEFEQRLHGAPRQGAVKRGRHSEAARGDTGRGQPPVQSLDRPRGPRDYGLARRVDVREPQVRDGRFLDRRRDGVRVRANREHRAGLGVDARKQFASMPGQAQQALRVHHAARVQCD